MKKLPKILTDEDVRQIQAMKKIKLQPWQVVRITGVSLGKVQKIFKMKVTRNTYKKRFDWKEYNNSIII